MKIQIDDLVIEASDEQMEMIAQIQSAPSVEERAKATTDAKSAVLAKLGLTAEEATILLG